jgi:hypothetical protein
MANPRVGTLMSLKEAVDQFRREPRAWSNAYDWYRRDAQRRGRVHLGRRRQLSPTAVGDLRVTKIAGKWTADAAEFNAIIEEHRAAVAELQQLTRDYDNHILHGATGSTIWTEFGGYVRARDFHRTWNTSIRPWKDYGDWWTCSHCWKPATLEHDKPECNTCSDWGSCGRDCTLSRVLCETCDTSMAV